MTWSAKYWAPVPRPVPYAIRDELFTQMKAKFTDRQIVELTLRFALCSAWNKFNDALQLDTESAVQQAFAEL